MTKPKNPTLVPDLDLSKEGAVGESTEKGIGIPPTGTKIPNNLPDKLPPLPATAGGTQQATTQQPSEERPVQPAARLAIDAEHPAPRQVEREPQRPTPNISSLTGLALALLVAGAMVAGAIIWNHNQAGAQEVAKKVTTTSATTTVTTTTEPAPVPAPVINVTVPPSPPQVVYVPAPVPTPPTPVTPRRRGGSRNAPGAAVANVDDDDEKKREAHVASEIARVQVEARTSERTRFEAASQPTVTP